MVMMMQQQQQQQQKQKQQYPSRTVRVPICVLGIAILSYGIIRMYSEQIYLPILFGCTIVAFHCILWEYKTMQFLSMAGFFIGPAFQYLPVKYECWIHNGLQPIEHVVLQIQPNWLPFGWSLACIVLWCIVVELPIPKVYYRSYIGMMFVIVNLTQGTLLFDAKDDHYRTMNSFLISFVMLYFLNFDATMMYVWLISTILGATIEFSCVYAGAWTYPVTAGTDYILPGCIPFSWGIDGVFCWSAYAHFHHLLQQPNNNNKEQ